jgi:colicin import membrane protein
MRDWYAYGQLTVLPAAATLLLHGLVLAMLLLRWQGDSELRTIEARVLPPSVINATLIDAESLKRKANKARPAPKQAAPRPQSTPQPRQSAPASSAAAAAKTAPGTTANTTPKPAPKAAPAPAPAEPEERRISAEELAAISRRELAASLEAEESSRVAVTAEQMAASYAALIRDTVTGYWSRPPSARNGMQAVLELQLVPTGEIVSVRVLESSGSVAFDRSAMNAVDKAGAFPELKNLPPREFENNFRRFRLLFRPEDLRY